MRRETYSGKKQIVAMNGAPIRGLSDADDAIVATLFEETFGPPQVDLYGQNAQLVENMNISGTITVKVKNSSPDLTTLSVMERSRAPIAAVTVKDIGTNTAGVIGRTCHIQRAPDYQRGKTPQDVVWVFVCGELKITHDGPRILPV